MFIHKDDILRFHSELYALVVPVSGSVRTDGSAIIDDPLTQEIVSRFPELPWTLGDKITLYDSQVFYYYQWNLFTFPIKAGWNEKANQMIIAQSCQQLRKTDAYLSGIPIVMNKIGCEPGNLKWEQVEPFIEMYLPDILIVSKD